jgi:D-beta-D-heptose 7-phosphate kinase/D-beta-D-heptose 1-phosphate adenosyltransferase
MLATVFHNAFDLKQQIDIYNEKLIVTSGGFDPMHVGHLRCLIESAEIARKSGPKFKLAVIVNSDGFLLRKKGYAFMPESERLEIIAGVRGVDYVIPWDDGSQTVTGALEIIRPFAFTKGGDRDAAANVPEFDLCEKLGTKVIFNVGGGKIQSSSSLVSSLTSRS